MKMDPILRFSGPHRFLSNFYPARVTLSFAHEEKRYEYEMPTVEHAFQAAKINPKHPNRIAVTESFLGHLDGKGSLIPLTPAEAKKKGRHVPMREDWSQIRIPVMHRLLKQKFSHPHLRERLLATGDADLFEGNYWNDRFWGVDMAGEGENHLGKLLMLVRSEILQGQG